MWNLTRLVYEAIRLSIFTTYLDKLLVSKEITRASDGKLGDEIKVRLSG